MQGFYTTGAGTVVTVHKLLDKLLLTLTPCSRVFLEKLTGFRLVKKFPAFYGNEKFITAFKNSHQLSPTIR
jgi:hypothetical protein